MANEDRQSEHFIREVDEELRRAQLKAIWDRFASVIIGACVLVVLITAGYRGWLWWEERQAAASGDRFMAAVEAIESGNREEGAAALARIAEEGSGGYPVLAQLRLAGERAAAGAKEDAIAAYDSVAADVDASQAMRDLARIRAALLALDLGDMAGATERAAQLDQAGNPWRHAAREVLGMAAYGRGELQEARDFFTAIQQDAETPPDLWARSGMMVSLIDGQLAPAGAPTQTPVEAEASPPAMPAAPRHSTEIPRPVSPQPAEAPAAPAPETPAAAPAATPGASAPGQNAPPAAPAQ